MNYEMEERAAIKEFEAGLSREEAEQQALSEELWMIRDREKMNGHVRELNDSEARRHHLPDREPLYPHDEIVWFEEGEEDGEGESSVDKSSAAVADQFGALAARE